MLIVALDSQIPNPNFKPVQTQFRTVKGCIAAWRGDFSVDLTGNGHTLTPVGRPNQGVFSVLCNKDNGYLTNVPDGINRTLVVVHRLPATVAAPDQTYSNPLGNLSQSDTNTGVGIGIVQASAAHLDLHQMNGCVGADKKDTPLFSKAKPAQDKPVSNAMRWQWSAFAVDADNNFCAMYIPRQLDDLVMGANASGVQLKNRWVTNLDGSPAYYRIGAWRDPSTPGVKSSAVEIAYAAIYDRPFMLSDMRQQYQNEKYYMAQFGHEI